ncbi:MAG: histidine triad nucleotide-binding protein [Chloroflexi bacterium]|nr:histidine triad nucleotide-binding protein [Chloroflexota bacterium]
MASDCVFCKIAAGESDGRVLYHDERVTAFWDIHPVAPVHILIVPNKHISSVNAMSEEDEALVGHLVYVAKLIAKEQGVDQEGYRLSINTGPNAGQSVFHIHVHLLAGRSLPIHIG